MKTYDVIIIGGGPAGLVASKLLVAFGKSVAIVESRKLGGDCTHRGCIPSKTLLKAAQMVYDAKQLSKYGVTSNSIELDTSNVLTHVKKVVDEIYSHETPVVFNEAGVAVIEGFGTFESRDIIAVNNELYKAKKFIIATGSQPKIPSIEGIKTINYLTNETIFEQKKIPKSMIIVGAGVIAIEMATAFNRLGTKVTVVSRSEGVLKENDEELTAIVQKQLIKEGITFLYQAEFLGITKKKNIKLRIKTDDEERVLKASTILFATGRQANTNIGLDKAGIEFDNSGIKVDDYLTTSNPNIYAIGDVSTRYKFTHIAEQEAIVAASNIAFPVKKKINYEHIGWSVYCDPELAHIGLTFNEAKQQHQNVQCYRFEYKNSDRGYTDVVNEGVIKVTVKPNGKILGATILGQRAGELIHQLQLAKTLNISFDQLSKMVYLYPTFSDIIKQSSREFYIQKLLRNPLLKLIKKAALFFQGKVQ